MVAPWRCGFLEKCHQIAVALQVSYGGIMAATIALIVVAVIAEDNFF